MAKSLVSLSIDALLEMRDSINKVLSSKVDGLREQLARLEGAASGSKRRGRKLGSKNKLVAKYRGPDGETWVGRGARPRWLSAALQRGAKLDDFAIAGVGGAKKKAAVKLGQKAKK